MEITTDGGKRYRIVLHGEFKFVNTKTGERITDPDEYLNLGGLFCGYFPWLEIEEFDGDKFVSTGFTVDTIQEGIEAVKKWK